MGALLVCEYGVHGVMGVAGVDRCLVHAVHYEKSGSITSHAWTVCCLWDPLPWFFECAAGMLYEDVIISAALAQCYLNITQRPFGSVDRDRARRLLHLSPASPAASVPVRTVKDISALSSSPSRPPILRQPFLQNPTLTSATFPRRPPLAPSPSAPAAPGPSTLAPCSPAWPFGCRTRRAGRAPRRPRPPG